MTARGVLASLAWAGLAFSGLGFLPRRGRGFALGGFLALGRALLRSGAILRGGLLRRNVLALLRNSGDVFGNSGFYVRHGGEYFLRLVAA